MKLLCRACICVFVHAGVSVSVTPYKTVCVYLACCWRVCLCSSLTRQLNVYSGRVLFWRVTNDWAHIVGQNGRDACSFRSLTDVAEVYSCHWFNLPSAKWKRSDQNVRALTGADLIFTADIKEHAGWTVWNLLFNYYISQEWGLIMCLLSDSTGLFLLLFLSVYTVCLFFCCFTQ